MSEISNTLSVDEILEIAKNDDFHIAPFRADKNTFGTLTWIWSVEVNGGLFVRAYNGKKSSWYQSAIKQKSGKITAAGMEKLVQFEAVEGEVNNLIDEAYKEKYAQSPYLNSMISEKARSANIKILSFS